MVLLICVTFRNAPPACGCEARGSSQRASQPSIAALGLRGGTPMAQRPLLGASGPKLAGCTFPTDYSPHSEPWCMQSYKVLCGAGFLRVVIFLEDSWKDPSKASRFLLKPCNLLQIYRLDSPIRNPLSRRSLKLALIIYGRVRSRGPHKSSV